MNIGNVGLIVFAVLISGCLSTVETRPSESKTTAERGEVGTVLNRIPGTEAIEIPEAMTDKQALDAVEMALNGTSPGERNNSWVSKWRPEMRDTGNRWIRVGLKARQHYLCVCYRVEGRSLVPDVPTSTNLGQNGVRIHRKVPIWINNLKPLIQMQMYGIVNGTNCIGTKASARNRRMLAEARQAEAQAVKAEADAAVASEQAEKVAPPSFCSHCGAKVSAAANYCGSCGRKIK